MRRPAAQLTVFALMAAGLFGTTASPAADPTLVRFTALGDISASPAAGGVLSAIASRDDDLTVALGDLSYGTTGQEQAWCDFVTSRVGAGYPFELIAGNHESDGINGNINDFSACLPNQLPGLVGTYGRQWYVDVPAEAPLVRYVMISPALTFPDGPWSYAAGTPRYAWTERAIDGARTEGIPWVVVGMHKPCLSLGQYACDTGVPDVFNLLVSKRVDLVLNGHEHLYQRTKQLRLGAGCGGIVPGAHNAACVADDDSTLVKGAGTVTVTVGTGGNTLRNVNSADAEAPYFAAASGLNQSPTFGALGVSATPDQLSATFVRSGSGTFDDAFTITRDPGTPNESPVASFTSSCDQLTCGFDGTGSSDPDGSVGSYAWDFGDGSLGTGATPSHPYAAGGTYTVGLTVTDDVGATHSATQTVTVSGMTTYASDDFDRTVPNGFGSAPVGGPWTVSAATSNFAVADGVGTVRLAAGAGLNANLTGVSPSAVDIAVKVSTDKHPTGGGLYTSVIGRRVGTASTYRAKVWLRSNGAVSLSLVRTSSTGAQTLIQPDVVIAGLSYALGDVLNVRTQVTGSSPTTVRARVWEQGMPEPTSWHRSTTDATSDLQTAGSIGTHSFLSGNATNGPVTVLLDDLRATLP